MFKRPPNSALVLGGLLSAIALSLLIPTVLNRKTPTENIGAFKPPDVIRAVVIAPETTAVKLEAIDSQ
ncbi:MAG: hypothetical protein AAF635_15040 [Cyanobacteria bacterium P01_C01_bin.69]